MLLTDLKDAYICYNGADLDWVRQLAEHLETETIDGNRQSRALSVFFDKWDIAAGQSIIDRMNDGMESARHVVTVLSPQFLRADWPRFEWKHIVANDPNNTRGVLVPILLRDLTKDGKERIELCAPFRDLRYIDFRKPAEFKRSFVELVRRIRNQPTERGRKLVPLASITPVLPTPFRPEVSWLPDRVQDLLISNLLQVKALPPRIWGADTDYRKRRKSGRSSRTTSLSSSAINASIHLPTSTPRIRTSTLRSNLEPSRRNHGMIGSSMTPGSSG